MSKAPYKLIDHSAKDKRVHIRNPFFAVRKLESGDAKGLLSCLERAMTHVGVGNDWRKKIIGFGCDGASVNIANRGLKGLLHESAPWVNLGQGYKNNLACTTFIKYIATESCNTLVDALCNAKFFSIQADASTDSGNIEDELFLAVYLTPCLSSNSQIGSFLHKPCFPLLL